MSQRQITIGPEFFAKAKNDYADWHWALIREFMQNSIDCGSTEIKVVLDEQVDNGQPITIMTVDNDGESMTEDILVNKLLCLGGSGKNFGNGSVGGFGKAKEILYFCHRHYSIRSGDLLVQGSGAGYTLEHCSEKLPGTKSFIIIEGHCKYKLEDELRRFASFCQWSGILSLHGARLDTALAKGSRRRDLGFATVYTNKSCEYRMVVRIGGVPMFVERVGHNRCVVVELSGKSSDVLTANRDGLVRPFSGTLSNFITELAVDKRSALRDKGPSGPQYSRFAGRRIKHSKQQEGVVREARDEQVHGILHDLVQPGAVAARTTIRGESCDGVNIGVDEAPDFAPAANEATNQGGGLYAPDFGSDGAAPQREVATLGEEFVLKNELDMAVPAYYSPDSGEFSGYSRRLVRIWGRLMLTLHQLFDVEAEFGLGFIFSDSAEAEYESKDYGPIYYLNPAEVVEQASGSRSLRKRFKLTERNRLISIATHEFVHGVGLGWHDEAYANKLTDYMAVVMDNRAKFNWCFA